MNASLKPMPATMSPCPAPSNVSHNAAASRHRPRVRGTVQARPGRYDIVARALHWIFAVLIIYASGVGYALSRISDPVLHHRLSQLNMSLGTVLLVLFPLRAAWKLLRTGPRPLAGVPRWQHSVAHAVHSALYVLIGIVLLSGYLMVPNGYVFFGILTIPTPFDKGMLTEALFAVHRVGCALLATLVVLHVLAVIKHQLIARIDVLRRMC